MPNGTRSSFIGDRYGIMYSIVAGVFERIGVATAKNKEKEEIN